MSKILNHHNFISVNATNTELTSLCSSWSGNSSALISLLCDRPFLLAQLLSDFGQR